LRAVGPTGAWVYVNEFFGWRRFRNRKEVGAAAGLTPTPYQSGDERREQGISKAGSRHIRAVAIEMAWGWLRYQPRSRLSQWYQARFGRGGTRARKVGIVALARKLLIALWRNALAVVAGPECLAGVEESRGNETGLFGDECCRNNGKLVGVAVRCAPRVRWSSCSGRMA